MNTEDVLKGHVGRFQSPKGADLLARTDDFFQWQDARRQAGVWPYSRSLNSAPKSVAAILDDRGVRYSGLNFASQDYLGLAAHPKVHAAITEALAEFGPHSAGSPVLLGNTRISLALEQELAEAVQMPEVVLFPTGWAAGFGAITGLVRPSDHIILDSRAHACLQRGACAVTTNLHLTPHLDADAVKDKLAAIRQSDADRGIMVVTEGLFSMDADTPNLRQVQDACHEYSATLLVDVAHDFGSMGPAGTGALGAQGMLGDVDLVMGSFSKTFASNGGFLACKTPAVKQFVKVYSGPHLFSNALSPLQVATVRQALAIVRSLEGDELRAANQAAAIALREECTAGGLTCIGTPSPIVPVTVGSNKAARIASNLLAYEGVLANLVEYPAVAANESRFRFQVMSSHTPSQCRDAARRLIAAVIEAREVAERVDSGVWDDLPLEGATA